MTSTLFFYGTLCHLPLLEAVLNVRSGALVHRMGPAVLPDHRVCWVRDDAYPMLEKAVGHSATGVVLRAVTEDEEDRIRYYESAFSYHLCEVLVDVGGGSEPATCFYPMSFDQARGADWVLEDWVRIWGEMAVGAARDVMARRARYDAEAAAHLRPFLMARQWSRLIARQTATPTTRRYSPKPEDVTLAPLYGGYRGFFELAEFQFDHQRFDGSRSPTVTRETFVAFDAALVLPYDPGTDHVLLIEQLRFGPLWRNDPHPWVFEPIAGLVDAGEDPADTARREAVEEAGLRLGPLEPMVRIYASPGYSTEFFHCFLGVVDLSEFSESKGGLASENEDIRSHVMTFEDAMALVATGEINVGPLVMMLYWLAAERSRLRASA